MLKDKIPQGIFIHIHSKGWMDKNEIMLQLQKWSTEKASPFGM
jgi:hypothetical protein